MSELEVQCGRCGSSLFWEDCEVCRAIGHWDEPDPACPVCHGSGSVPICASGWEWCQRNPRPGREEVKPNTVEQFEVSPHA